MPTELAVVHWLLCSGNPREQKNTSSELIPKSSPGPFSLEVIHGQVGLELLWAPRASRGGQAGATAVANSSPTSQSPAPNSSGLSSLVLEDGELPDHTLNHSKRPKETSVIF